MIFCICLSILIQVEANIVLNKCLHYLVSASHDSGLFETIFLFHEWLNSVCYTFGFPLSCTANCVYAEPWIDFLDKPYMGGQKIHFL